MKYLVVLYMIVALCNCDGEVVIPIDDHSSDVESSSMGVSSVSSQPRQTSSRMNESSDVHNLDVSSDDRIGESSEEIVKESSYSDVELSGTEIELSTQLESSIDNFSSFESSSNIPPESSEESSSQSLIYPYIHKSIYKNVPTSEKVVALTFDDGPDFETGSTEAFLQFFKEYDMKVTFFHIGKNALASPDKVWRVLEEGHQIGNHSMTHEHIIEKDIVGLEYEIKGFQNYYIETFNYAPTVFRAPFLEINDDMWDLFQTLQLPPIDAIVDIVDWGDQPVGEIKDRLMNQIEPGAIVLCHERMKTLDVLKESIADLKDQGYQFVTLNELLEYQD
ncbi:MAG: polysaccharide deacetylase family protein [Fibrobacterales bacterium]